MTRTTHKSHPTPSFPVYCLDWADDQTLLLGGGGGASRSGISNMLVRNLRRVPIDVFVLNEIENMYSLPRRTGC